PLKWSKKLADFAASWAHTRQGDCELIHSDTSYGENLFWGSGKQWSHGDAVAAWAAERCYYDHAANSCRKGQDCLHYTQMVWRQSTRIGCARVVCKSEHANWRFSASTPTELMGLLMILILICPLLGGNVRSCFLEDPNTISSTPAPATARTCSGGAASSGATTTQWRRWPPRDATTITRRIRVEKVRIACTTPRWFGGRARELGVLELSVRASTRIGDFLLLLPPN
ncbi:unnamed protein product, partial [Linum tenue]